MGGHNRCHALTSPSAIISVTSTPRANAKLPSVFGITGIPHITRCMVPLPNPDFFIMFVLDIPFLPMSNMILSGSPRMRYDVVLFTMFTSSACPPITRMVRYGRKEVLSCMKKLSKTSRKILEIFRNTPPTIYGRYYLVGKMDFPSEYTQDVVFNSIDRLVEIGALNMDPGNMGGYRLTDIGQNWPEYNFLEKRDIFLKSILCPIIVTLLTEAVIHGLPLLLALIPNKG